MFLGTIPKELKHARILLYTLALSSAFSEDIKGARYTGNYRTKYF
jgi:hypothetical protein